MREREREKRSLHIRNASSAREREREKERKKERKKGVKIDGGGERAVGQLRVKSYLLKTAKNTL